VIAVIEAFDAPHAVVTGNTGDARVVRPRALPSRGRLAGYVPKNLIDDARVGENKDTLRWVFMDNVRHHSEDTRAELRVSLSAWPAKLLVTLGQVSRPQIGIKSPKRGDRHAFELTTVDFRKGRSNAHLSVQYFRCGSSGFQCTPERAGIQRVDGVLALEPPSQALNLQLTLRAQRQVEAAAEQRLAVLLRVNSSMPYK
jgi:hypothetical protein